jgi:hypothetical protein
VFNPDGTVTQDPVNWWVTGTVADPFVRYSVNNPDYTAEWQLCDGTVVKGDSILLSSINCTDKTANLVLKDSDGNVVYTENVSFNNLTTRLKPVETSSAIKLRPNPVEDVLNIVYFGAEQNKVQVDIFSIDGKLIIRQYLFDVISGQNIAINVNSLGKGIYVCKITSEGKLVGLNKFSK